MRAHRMAPPETPDRAHRRKTLGIRLRAEIHGPSEIRFSVEGADAPADVEAYRLTDGRGADLPLASVSPGGRSRGDGGARRRRWIR